MFLLKVHELPAEGKFKITGYREADDTDVWDQENFIEVAEVVYNYVVSKFDNNDLTYGNHITELALHQVQLTPVDTLQGYKNNCLGSYKYFYLDKHISYDFFIITYEYMTIGNILAANGYYITEQNREEKYLEILNSGDGVLIAYLESYLEILDDIKEQQTFVDNFIAIRRELKEAATIEEVRAIYQEKTGRDLISDIRS